MTRPAFEMADIVRRRGKQFLQRFKAVLSYQQLKAYRAVKRCRTAALGGHRDKCEDCTYEAPFSYNSCRSRCCPKCQAQARKRWLQIQQRDLLNTNYYGMVRRLILGGGITGEQEVSHGDSHDRYRFGENRLSSCRAKCTR